MTSTRRRRGLAVAAAGLATVAVLLGGAHTSVGRALAWSWLQKTLIAYGIDARARSFDYNLLTLDLRVDGIALSVPGRPDDAFFSADRIHVKLPARILLGRWSADSIDIVRPRVRLHRAKDGTTNWPSTSAGTPSRAPGALDLGMLRVVELDVAVVDERAAQTLDVHALSFELPAPGTQAFGRLTLTGLARFNRGDQQIALQRLSGGLRFDGLNLLLQDLQFESEGGRLQIDGRLGPLAGDPPLDLVARGSLDLALVSKWVDVPGAPAGTMTFDGSIRGSASRPEVAIGLNGDGLAWAGLRALSFQSKALWKSGAIDISALTVRLADAELRGTAHVTLDGEPKPGALTAAWTRLPLAAAQSALRLQLPFELAASMDGKVDARWTDPQADRLTLTLENRSRGVPGPGRLDADGSVAVDVRGGRWQARVDTVIGRAVRIDGSSGGRVSDDPLASTLSGSVDVTASDLGAAWRAARAANVLPATATRSLDGHSTVHVSLDGTLASPRIASTWQAEDIRYGFLGPASLAVQATLADGRVDISSVDLQSSGNAINASGRVTLASRAIDGRLDARLSDLASLSTDVPAWLRPAGSAAATVELSGTWLRPRARVRANGESFALAGQWFDRWSAAVHTDGDEVATVDELKLSQGGGSLTASGRYGWTDASYALALKGQSLTLRPIPRDGGAPPIAVNAAIDVEFDGSGSLSDPQGRGRLSASGVTWDDTVLGDVDTEFSLVQQSLHLSAFVVDQPIVVNATLGVAPFGPFVLDANIDEQDVARLTARWPAASALSRGAVSAGLHAAGDLRDFSAASVSADVRQLEATLDSTPVRLTNRSRLNYAARQLEIDEAQIRIGDTTLRIGGRMGPDTSQTLTATLDGRIRDLTFIVPIVAQASQTTAPSLDADGSVHVTVTARGEPAHPSVEGALVVRDGSVQVGDVPGATRISLEAKYTDAGVDLQQLAGLWQGARIAATGHVPAALLTGARSSGGDPVSAGADRARLRLRVDSATEAMLAHWLDSATLERVRGEIAGSLTIDADALAMPRVRGEITLDRAQTTIAGIALGQTRPTRVAIEDGRARIVDWEWAGTSSRIALSGGGEIGPQPSVDITTEGLVDLALLGAFVPDVATAGQARVVVRTHGSLSSPEFDGRIDVSGGEVRLTDPQLIVTALAGTLTLTRDRVTTAGLEGSANGGTLRLSGTLGYGDLPASAGSLSVTGRGIALDLQGLRTEVDADLRLTRTAGRAAVSGVATARHGAYRAPLSLTGGLQAALRQQGIATASTSGSALEAIDLNIRVTSSDDVIVDNNYAELQMATDVRLAGTAARPGLVGRATVREGGQIFLGGNTYRVVGDGTIDFTDVNRIAPNLSIAAATRVSDREVTLTIKGTPETLRTDLSSDPPLGQADLVSLLVTGRTLNEAGGGALAIPREQLLGYLSGEFLGAAGRAVGLDTIRIQRGLPDVQFNAGLVATETDPSSRLTFAKNVTPDLQLIFSQNLKQTGGLTWIVSDRLRSNIEARAVSLDNGDRSYDVRHDVSFGGPATPRRRSSRTTAERIVALAFTGQPEGGAGRWLDRVKLRQGDAFDFFKWQNDRDRLEKLFHDDGYYEARVSSARKTVVQDGVTAVALEYDIRRGPSTTVTVEGYDLPSRVVRSVQDAWKRATFDQAVVDEARSLAVAHLADRGYLRATVSVVMEGDTERRHLVLRVSPGPRTTHREIQWSGNAHITTARLRSFVDAQRLSDVAWSDPARFRAALVARFQEDGLLGASARVGPPVFDASTAALPVDLVEGPEFRVAQIAIEGVRDLAEEDVRHALELKAGDPYTPLGLTRARERLEARYRKEGFAEAVVTLATRVHADTAGVDVSVTIREGSRHVLRDVVVTGATRTHPNLISRTLQLDVGQPVDLTRWYEARSRLYDTGVFRRVDIEEEPIDDEAAPESAASEQPARAKVTLEEWPPLRARYGLQVNDATKPATDTRQFDLGVSGDLTYRNLFGRAMSAGLAARYDADFRAGRAFVTAPALAGRPITSNFFVSMSREDIGQASIRPFVTDKVDLTAEQRVRPWGRLELAYSYNYQRNHTFDLDADPSDPFAFDIAVHIARLNGTLLADTRDDLVDATRGWFHSSSVEYAAQALGSDVRFAKYVIQQYYYRSLPGRIVLASAGRLGLATAFGQQLIPSERFFAGGGTSVRGFAQDGLGPVDVFGSLSGGDGLMVVNQEVRFPLFKWFRGVGFVDAGNVFDSVADLSPGGLRASVGIGTRIQTPVALIRIDYGVPLRRGTGEPRGRWIFSVGQAF